MVASHPANHFTTRAETNQIFAQSNLPRVILELSRDAWSSEVGHMCIFPHLSRLLEEEAIRSQLGYGVWDCTDSEAGRSSFHPPCLVSLIHRWHCSFITSGRPMVVSISVTGGKPASTTPRRARA